MSKVAADGITVAITQSYKDIQPTHGGPKYLERDSVDLDRNNAEKYNQPILSSGWRVSKSILHVY